MRLAALLLVMATACGRFPLVRDELAECWPSCGDGDGDADVPRQPFPFSFDDPAFFADVEPSSVISVGCESVSDASITDSAGVSAILNTCNVGASTLTRVRTGGAAVVDGYRCARSGVMNIVDSWIETSGGRAIQCFDPNNTPTASLNVSGTVLYARAVASEAVFIADSYAVDVRFANVLVRGGNYGLRFHTDGRPGTLALDDVCFYGESASSNSFGAAPYLLAPTPPTITAWNNVSWCTIVDGELVRHAAIPRPE